VPACGGRDNRSPDCFKHVYGQNNYLLEFHIMEDVKETSGIGMFSSPNKKRLSTGEQNHESLEQSGSLWPVSGVHTELL